MDIPYTSEAFEPYNIHIKEEIFIEDENTDENEEMRINTTENMTGNQEIVTPDFDQHCYPSNLTAPSNSNEGSLLASNEDKTYSLSSYVDKPKNSAQDNIHVKETLTVQTSEITDQSVHVSFNNRVNHISIKYMPNVPQPTIPRISVKPISSLTSIPLSAQPIMKSITVKFAKQSSEKTVKQKLVKSRSPLQTIAAKLPITKIADLCSTIQQPVPTECVPQQATQCVQPLNQKSAKQSLIQSSEQQTVNQNLVSKRRPTVKKFVAKVPTPKPDENLIPKIIDSSSTIQQTVQQPIPVLAVTQLSTQYLQPLKQQSAGQLLTQQSVQQPLILEAVQQPLIPEAVQQPLIQEAVQQPLIQEAVQQPLIQQSLQQLVFQQSVQQPLIQQFGNQPVFQQSVQQPLIQQSLQQPVFQQSGLKQPLMQQSVQHPVFQQTVQQSLIQQSVQHQLFQQSVLLPVFQQSVQQSFIQQSGQQPLIQQSVQQQSITQQLSLQQPVIRQIIHNPTCQLSQWPMMVQQPGVQQPQLLQQPVAHQSLPPLQTAIPPQHSVLSPYTSNSSVTHEVANMINRNSFFIPTQSIPVVQVPNGKFYFINIATQQQNHVQQNIVTNSTMKSVTTQQKLLPKAVTHQQLQNVCLTDGNSNVVSEIDVTSVQDQNMHQMDLSAVSLQVEIPHSSKVTTPKKLLKRRKTAKPTSQVNYHKQSPRQITGANASPLQEQVLQKVLMNTSVVYQGVSNQDLGSCSSQGNVNGSTVLLQREITPPLGTEIENTDVPSSVSHSIPDAQKDKPSLLKRRRPTFVPVDVNEDDIDSDGGEDVLIIDERNVITNQQKEGTSGTDVIISTTTEVDEDARDEPIPSKKSRQLSNLRDIRIPLTRLPLSVIEYFKRDCKVKEEIQRSTLEVNYCAMETDDDLTPSTQEISCGESHNLCTTNQLDQSEASYMKEARIVLKRLPSLVIEYLKSHDSLNVRSSLWLLQKHITEDSNYRSLDEDEISSQIAQGCRQIEMELKEDELGHNDITTDGHASASSTNQQAIKTTATKLRISSGNQKSAIKRNSSQINQSSASISTTNQTAGNTSVSNIQIISGVSKAVRDHMQSVKHLNKSNTTEKLITIKKSLEGIQVKHKHGLNNQLVKQSIKKLNARKKPLTGILNSMKTKLTWDQHLRQNYYVDSQVLVHSQKKIFKCNVCNKFYYHAGGVNQHLLEHKQHILCEICNTYQLISTYGSHLQKHAKKVKKFECIICNKKFSRRKILLCHTAAHTQNWVTEKVYCNTCDDSFWDKEEFKKHKLLHSQKNKDICVLCSRDFENASMLHLHMKNDHLTQECNICKKRFSAKGYLKKHKEQKHPERFSTKGNVKKHKQKHSECEIYEEKITTIDDQETSHVRKNKHICEICDKEFHNEKSLEVHIQHDHMTYECTICKETFTNKEYLEKHMEKHAEPGICVETIIPVNDHETLHIESKKHICEISKTEFSKETSTNKNYLKQHAEPEICEEKIGSINYHESLCTESKKHICEICEKEFQNELSLNVHIQHDHMTHTCNICKETCTNKEYLEKHMEQHTELEICVETIISENDHEISHIESKKHICEICKGEFQNEMLLEVHKQHDCTTRECNTFKENFTNKDSLKKHMEQPKIREEKIVLINDHETLHTKCKKYICEICKAEFYTESTFKVHIQHGHTTYECNICHETFPSKYYMKKHIEQHAEPKICEETIISLNNHKTLCTQSKKCICEICKKEFQHEKSLKNHVQNNHKTHKCTICKEIFTNKYYLKKHMEQHADPEICKVKIVSSNDRKTLRTQIKEHICNKYAFICDVCKTEFDNKVTLKFHIQYSHLSYECYSCKDIFTNKDKFKKHMEQHLEPKISQNKTVMVDSHVSLPTQSKKHTCKICVKDFHNEMSLQLHIQYNHVSFQCVICNARLTITDNLKKHMEEHTQNEALFECAICKQFFLSKAELEKHKDIHTETSKNELYSCDICNERFSLECDLDKHVNAHFET